MPFDKCIVEDSAVEWFAELGYEVGHGLYLAHSEPAEVREPFSDVVLVGRLREAIRRCNRATPPRGPSSLGSTLLPKLLSGELNVS
jgi:type I restriction enzyme, R subunit